MKEVLMEVEADWRVYEEMAERLEIDLIIEYTEQCSEETDTHLPIYDPDDDIESIRVHVRHLRTKLEPDPRHPRYIKTVYGAVYCLELPSTPPSETELSATEVETSPS